jgi:hypothetical protein
MHGSPLYHHARETGVDLDEYARPPQRDHRCPAE